MHNFYETISKIFRPFNFDKITDRTHLRNVNILTFLFFLCVFVLAVFTVLNFSLDKPYRAYINITALILIVLTVIYFKFSSNFNRALFFLVLILLSTLSSLHLISPDFLSSNIIWFPIFIFVASYLHDNWSARILLLIGTVLFVLSTYFRSLVNIEIKTLSLSGGIITDISAIIFAAISVHYIVVTMLKEDRQMKKDLLRGQEMLKELNESNSALLAVMSHDLATPLTIMHGYISQCRTDEVAYEKVTGALNNFQEILEEVKKLRSIGTGKLNIEVKQTPLLQVLRVAIMDVSDRASSKNVKINLGSYDQSEKFFVLAEQISLRSSVLVNILSNCIKFSYRDSSIDLKIEDKGETTHLTVQDYGIGIPNRIKNVLYEFSTVTTRRGTDGEKGTGFGMPIVKMFVDRYDAEISVESRSVEKEPFEHGTTFVIVFKNAKNQS